MTLLLELSPSEEQELQTIASRDGVPVSEFAHKLIATGMRQRKTFEKMQAEVAAGFAASGETEESMEAFINQTVKQVRAEMSANTLSQ